MLQEVAREFYRSLNYVFDKREKKNNLPVIRNEILRNVFPEY